MEKTGLFLNEGRNKVLALVLTMLVLFALAPSAWLWWQIYGIGGWRDSVYGLSSLYAARQAFNDYKEGYLRLYRLGGKLDEAQYTGETEGEYEIWNPQFYPEMSCAHRYEKEVFIKFYNLKMHYMREHPEDFPPPPSLAPQERIDGGGNTKQEAAK
ncbi:MAG: hypothetical protein BWY09_00274 [Candidatus Hydrogenedentes bacterium ADurb.Bin179]|nr:MAG: hypothetical protein BWY09_00274 [Candidatus Hydrogenedentes bacterium ADurb.Bin179]